jgi:hypothetical protein
MTLNLSFRSYEQLLITNVYIRFTRTIPILLYFPFPDVHLIYRVSDKRLLERYGAGKGYLNETQSGSVRPSGLRIKRAEARTKGAGANQQTDVRQIDENRKRSFND